MPLPKKYHNPILKALCIFVFNKHLKITHSPVILFSVCRWSWAIVWCPPIMVCSSVQCILRIRVCITAWPQRMVSSAHLLKSVSRFWAKLWSALWVINILPGAGQPHCTLKPWCRPSARLRRWPCTNTARNANRCRVCRTCRAPWEVIWANSNPCWTTGRAGTAGTSYKRNRVETWTKEMDGEMTKRNKDMHQERGK